MAMTDRTGGIPAVVAERTEEEAGLEKMILVAYLPSSDGSPAHSRRKATTG